MLTSGSLIATLILTFVAGVLATRWIMFGTFALDRSIIAAMVVVPLVQALVLTGWRRWTTRRRA